jgi:uncharacterized protein (DUF58 family)
MKEPPFAYADFLRAICQIPEKVRIMTDDAATGNESLLNGDEQHPGPETTIRKTLEKALKSVEPTGLVKKSAVISLLKKITRERMTPMGVSLLVLFAAATLFGAASPHIQLYWFAVLLLFIFVIPAFAPVPPVTVTRTIATRSKAGSILDYLVTIKNNSKRRHLYGLVINEVLVPEPIAGAVPRDLREQDQGAELDPSQMDIARAVEDLAPLQEITVPMALELPKRGFYRLDRLRAETIFPFGVWRRGQYQRDVIDDILVFPNFTPLEHLDLPIAMRYQPGGMALTSNLGESPEFLGVRDFRDGDNPRDIDWRCWARTGKPAVKEYQQEYFCRVALVLDTQQQGQGGAANDQFEAGISIAAAVSDRLSKQEAVIDIFAAGPNLYRLQAGRNLAFVENILEVLACLEATKEYPFQLVIPELIDEISQIASIVFVLLDWDDHRARFVQSVVDLGAAAKVILIRDSETTNDIAEAEGITGRPTVVLSTKDVAHGPSSL